MESVRVRVKHIIDFGTTISIVGIDLASNEPVLVHVDHRPFEAVLAIESVRGQPISFEAEGLMLSLNIAPETSDGGERRPKVAA